MKIRCTLGISDEMQCWCEENAGRLNTYWFMTRETDEHNWHYPQLEIVDDRIAMLFLLKYM